MVGWKKRRERKGTHPEKQILQIDIVEQKHGNQTMFEKCVQVQIVRSYYKNRFYLVKYLKLVLFLTKYE